MGGAGNLFASVGNLPTVMAAGVAFGPARDCSSTPHHSERLFRIGAQAIWMRELPSRPDATKGRSTFVRPARHRFQCAIKVLKVERSFSTLLPMTTRKFLKVLSVAVVGILSFGYLRRHLHDLAVSFRPRLSLQSPTGRFSEAEMENLVAFGEVLVDGRSLSGVERTHLRRHLGYRTENDPGFLSLYRMTAALLDRLAETRFSTLSREERANVLGNHGLTSYRFKAREYLFPFRRQELRVRALAVPDIIAGYYRSPAGWAVVRYETFPGQCGNLSRYTAPEV